jgi:hypothetical protein
VELEVEVEMKVVVVVLEGGGVAHDGTYLAGLVMHDAVWLA